MLFDNPVIVGAVIDRVLQTRQDTIYWMQYGRFLETRTRIFKTYLGTVTGVRAGSIIGQNDKKPIQERRTLGQGTTEVAYLGDRYQINTARLSDLQDIVDKFNAADDNGKRAIWDEIVNFIYDDFRQVLLMAHKRMDIVVGSLLMTGKAEVKLADNPDGEKMLDIELPFHTVTPTVTVKTNFITYLQGQVASLQPKYGKFAKMLMSRGTFVKNIIGSSEFSSTFQMILGKDRFNLASGLITSQMASDVMTGIGLPAIEIKEDFVEDQNDQNVQIYADDRITFLRSDDVLRMRHHTPYRVKNPLNGRSYNRVNGQGDLLISNFEDEEGRYIEYECEWLPEFIAPNKIVNFDLSTMNA
jgi:hypothetical protein